MNEEKQAQSSSETDSSVTQLSFNGCTYHISLPNADTDYIQKKLLSERIPYELDMLKDMQRRLSEGDFALDIGANIGNHSLFLAVVGKCRVTAFEPNDALCGSLLKSIELNMLTDRVNIRAFALGKVKGRGHFTKILPQNIGAQSIKVGEGGIQIAPLDSFQFSQPIKAIKIDVEGMELDVLEGGVRHIQTDRPIIYVECQTETDFRAVHDWFSKIDYEYWDTFNATPTHLFLPSERTTAAQRIARLQFKVVQEDYRARMQISAVRQKLKAANQKYRGANEQITALKQRVMQEETAHQAEQAAPQQQLAQLTADGQAKTVAVGEETKNLLRLEAELEATRSKLGEANQKYRGAGEQITALKQRVAQEEAARQAAEQSLAQASTLLEETQSYIQKERAALKQQLAQLTAEGQAKQGAAEESAKNLLRLEADLEGALIKLGEANQKYRGATEQVTALKQRVTQAEVAREAAEQALAQATIKLEQTQSHRLEERAALQQQLAQMTAEGQAKQGAAEESAKNLLRLEAELEGARNKLGEANQKYRGATEQVTALKQRVAQAEEAHQTVEQALTKTQSYLAEEHAALLQQVAQLSQQEHTSSAAADEAAKSLHRLEAELEAARSKLGEANQKYRGATEQLTVLKQRVTEEETARRTAEQAQAQVTTQLEQANSKYRQLTAEQIPELKSKLETQYSKAREGQHALEQLRLELQKNGKTLAETTRQLDKTRQQTIVAVQQLEKTRATISFQVGYQLIHGFKSVKGVRRLPSALWVLRKEAIRRRGKKTFVPSPPKLPALIVTAI